MTKFFVLIYFIVLSQVILGQNTSDTSVINNLNNYLISAHLADKFNGSVLIAQNGNILFRKSYGYKNVERHSLNDSNSIFQIGSLTKSFTSIVILKLQEEGKLSVHDHINKFLPDYPNGDNITIEQLLTHTSGIHNYTDDIGEEDSAIVCHPVSRERVMQFIENKKPDFKPGAKFGYNNSAFFLLGVIIEKITGEPYEKVVRDMIFTPLKMSHSGFDYINLTDTNKVQGYIILNKNTSRPNHVVDSTVYFSAGAIYSTTGDLYKWAIAIANHQLLSDSSWQQAFANFHNNNYGYGFFVDSMRGRKFVRHSGGGLGLMSDYLYFPQDNVIIILLNNFGNYGQSLFPTAVGLSNIVFHLPYTNWQQDTSLVQLTNETLKSFTGTYEYNNEHRLIVSFKNGNLYIEATNPKDRLPRVQLYALNNNTFYMKEAQLKFQFVSDDSGVVVKVLTYTTEDKKEAWNCIKIK